MARVVVGLSGGVDSSVAAYLLKEAGHEVIGLFMRNWLDDSVTIADECPWLEDSNDAMQVAEKLGIPFQILDLSADYKERIVDYMFDEYAKGRTPNPDVLCNREIKFDIFLKEAEKLGADFVATGHYCQKDEVVINGQTVYRLISGADGNKDQSYFLCQIDQHQLSKALFPIGHLQKPEVRRIAAEQELVTADKRDSQGLCFIGKVKLPVFLQQQLAAKQGDIVLIGAEAIHPYAETEAELSSESGTQLMDSPSVATLRLMSRAHALTPEMGRIIGQHQGAHYFTVGQRKGLGVGGFSSPLFIIGTDVETNTVYVGEGDSHPGLYRQAIRISADEAHWLREDHRLAIGTSRRYEVRIRYRQPLEKATIHSTEEGLYIDFDSAQRGVAAGQFAAWYEGEELIGSGVIGE